MEVFSAILLFLFLLSASNGETANDVTGYCDRKKYQAGVIEESLDVLDQAHPTLIEAVRNRVIVPDTDAPYNLPASDEDHIEMSGQFNQVSELVRLFGRGKRGFFIEAGAYDGYQLSNTLYFEKNLRWTGILVEPNPDAFADLLRYNRKAFAFGHCLSTTTRPQTVDFDAAGLIGGIVKDGKIENKDYFETFEGMSKVANVRRRTIKTQCFPLYSLIQAVGNRTVDLLVLDVEGAEFEILKSIPWDKVDIKVMMLEVEHFGRESGGDKEQMEKFLDGVGYSLYKSLFIDDVYVKKDFELPKNLKKPEMKKN